MPDRQLIAWSLERAAELQGDPSERVYTRLFAENPEMKALFVRDKTGQVRGNMLANVFEVMLDLAGPRMYGDNMIRAEIINHEGLGVPPAVFATFFAVVKTELTEMLGAEWSEAVEAAWAEIMNDVDAAIARNAA
jgi:hemoglobin-like flavoprotein